MFARSLAQMHGTTIHVTTQKTNSFNCVCMDGIRRTHTDRQAHSSEQCYVVGLLIDLQYAQISRLFESYNKKL